MAAMTHTKEFGVYYWDTFSCEGGLWGEKDTLEEAIQFAHEEFGDKIAIKGPHHALADQIDIVNSNGDIVKFFMLKLS